MALTISQLFADAAKKLVSDFAYIRSSNPHAGDRGEEAEEVVKTFLNNHIPQRFKAVSGVVIDQDNSLSKQTDVIVYDALSSPVFRYGEKTQILPVDTVAAVMEVKSRLTKDELKDGYQKIASVKALKKTPLTRVDKLPTGSEMAGAGTFGIVFGFDSDASLETLAENAKELNCSYSSELWPDIIVVLEKGVINYHMAYPGGDLGGEFMPPCTPDFAPPPLFIHLSVRQEPSFALNRFFTLLLAHLTFFPHRVSTPPFEAMFSGSSNKAFLLTAYQFDTQLKLRPVPGEMYVGHERPYLRLKISSRDGQLLGFLQFVPWQDGAVLSWRGKIGMTAFMHVLCSDVRMTIPHNGQEHSNVIKLSEEQFRTFPDRLKASSNLTGEIEDPQPD